MICGMDVIGIPYFKGPYSEGTVCSQMGPRQGPVNLHFRKIPSMKSIGKLGCFDVWVRLGGEAQRRPVQFEKNKNGPRQNRNLFFQRVPL